MGTLDDTEVSFDEEAGWLVARRVAAGVAVAVNLGPEPQDVPVEGAGDLLLSSSPAVARTAAGVALPADGVAVLPASGPALYL